MLGKLSDLWWVEILLKFSGKKQERIVLWFRDPPDPLDDLDITVKSVKEAKDILKSLSSRGPRETIIFDNSPSGRTTYKGRKW